MWPRIEAVQLCVASAWGVKRRDLILPGRQQSIAEPRQVAMALAWLLGPRSYAQVGRAFGGRHHTTVLHAVRRFSARLEGNDLRLLPSTCEALRLLGTIEPAQANAMRSEVA